MVHDGTGKRTAGDFLLAARRCELHGLEQLGVVASLVGPIGGFIHALQKERGVSNLFLGAGGTRFVELLPVRAAESDAAAVTAQRVFDALDLDSGLQAGGMRVYSRIAFVLHALDGLPELRERVRTLAATPAEATAAFSALVGGLLAVVFEAADAAADPVVSRALVAIFNFMQGKELAGQERATGAAGFAMGGFDPARRQRLLHLIEAQERCFQIFSEFAGTAWVSYWRERLSIPEVAEIERMRRIACTSCESAQFGPEMGDLWFERSSRRIDAMREVESFLATELRAMLDAKLREVHADLEEHRTRIDAFDTPAAGDSPQVAVYFSDPVGDEADASGRVEVLATGGLSRGLGRSILDLVHAQSRRLQAIGDELKAARAALEERKAIERAKGLLMQHRGLSEDEAYRMLRQMAMAQGRRMVEVAESTLALADFLKQERGV